jgi:hypothetical protein
MWEKRKVEVGATWKWTLDWLLGRGTEIKAV